MALEPDPQLAEAHDMAARIKFVWDRDWAVAGPLFSLVWDYPHYADLRQKLNLPKSNGPSTTPRITVPASTLSSPARLNSNT